MTGKHKYDLAALSFRVDLFLLLIQYILKKKQFDNATPLGLMFFSSNKQNIHKNPRIVACQIFNEVTK